MKTAFKDWAVVVDALARGEQIFILRKGGIHEGRGGFQVEHSDFLLLPTHFHQQRESVIPAAQERFDRLAPGFPPQGSLHFRYWAKLVEWHDVHSRDALDSLRGQHIWSEELLRERFEWGKQAHIFALVVRVYRLPGLVQVPDSLQYGGCKSWIQLDQDIDVADSAPVLSDGEFKSRLERFRGALLQSSSLQ